MGSTVGTNHYGLQYWKAESFEEHVCDSPQDNLISGGAEENTFLDQCRVTFVSAACERGKWQAAGKDWSDNLVNFAPSFSNLNNSANSDIVLGVGSYHRIKTA